MRKLLNHLLGEELVSKQSDKEIKEAFAGVAMCIAFAIMLHVVLCVFG